MRQNRQTTKRILFLAAASTVAFTLCGNLAWANTEDDVTITGAGAPLDNATSYTTTPATSSDITFAAATAYSGTFTLNSAPLSIGTLDDLNTTALTITGSQTITLNGGTNVVAPAGSNGGAAADLLFLIANSNLTINAPVALAVTGNFDTGSGASASIGGVISGAFGLNKTGAGTLTLSGINSYTGVTTVSAGVLNAASTSAPTTGGNITVANIAGNAVVNVTGFMTGSQLAVGTLSGASGAVNIVPGATLNLTSVDAGGNNDTFPSFGQTAGSYGALNMSGGTLNESRFQFGGMSSTTGGTGVGVITGGTVTTTGYLIMSRVGTSISSLTVNGGTVNHNAANNVFQLGLNGTGRAELSLLSGAINNAGQPLNFAAATGFTWTGTGVVNLNGGLLTTNSITYGSGTAFLNLNGGTVKANIANTAFITAAATVNGPFGGFAGGATIDTQAFAETITGNLSAPSGSGISTIAVATGGSGYIGAPYVSIAGTGTGATAIANMVDDGTGKGTLKIGSITVTNPGNNYTGTPTYTFTGGGAATAGTLGTFALAANTSGGLTKIGTGTLTLSGLSTFTGATTVTQGTLVFANNAALGSSTVTVAGGAGLTVNPNVNFASGTITSLGAVSIGAGGTQNIGAVTLNGGSLATTPGTVTFSSIAAGSGAHAINPGGIGSAGGVINVASLSLNSNSTLNYDLSAGSNDTINVTALNGFQPTGNPNFIFGLAPTAVGTYPLISFNTNTAPPDVSNFGFPFSTNSHVTYNYSVDHGTGNQYFIDLIVSGSGPQSYTFTSTQAAGDWNTTTNWTPNGTPGVAGDSVTFNNGIATAYTINLNGQQHVGSLTFNNSGAGVYTLAAGSGTNPGLFLESTAAGVSATIINQTNNNIITAPVTLLSSGNVIIASGKTLTMSGVISGQGALTTDATNAGILILGGAAANTYTGGTAISGGTVKLAGAGALSTALATVASGATLDLNNIAVATPLSLNGTGVGGAGALINSSGTGNPAVSGTVTLAGNATIGIANNVNITGPISGAFTLTKTGVAQLSVNNNGNSFSGGLNIQQGIVANGAGDTAWGAAGAPITMANGTNAYLTVAATNTHPFTVSGSVQLGETGNNKWLFSNANAFSGPGTATITRYSQAGATTTNDFQLTTNNSGYSGAWILTGGAVEAQNANSFGDGSATNTITMNGVTGTALEIANSQSAAPGLPQAIIIASTSASGIATLGSDSNTNAVYGGNITANANFTVRLGNYFATAVLSNVTFNGNLSGTGSISFIPAVGLTLSGQQVILGGNNSGYTANNTIPTGVVVTALTPTALGTGTWTINPTGGAEIDAALTGGAITITSGTGIANTGVIRNTSGTNASLGTSETLTGATTLGVSGAGNLTLNGNIAGNQALTVVGGTTNTGALVLGGTNAFSSVSILSGTVQTASATALAGSTTPPITVGNTSGAANAALLLGGATGYTIPNALTVAAGSTGTMTLGGVNPAGTTVGYGGALTINHSIIVDSTNAGATTAFTNAINGGAGVTLTKGPGLGTVQLLGGSNYPGATAINAGTLQFGGTNSGTGAITIATGATLSSVGGTSVSLAAASVTANGGSTIAPGGIGNTTTGTVLSLNGNLTLNNNSAVNFNFGTTSFNENITLGASSIFTINGNPFLTFTNSPGASQIGNSFVLFNDAGTAPSAAALAQIILPAAPSGVNYGLQVVGGHAIDLVVSGGSTGTSVWNPAGNPPVRGDDAGYSFNDPANWNPNTGVPSGSGATASFPNLQNIGLASNIHIVKLDAPQSVGTLQIDPGAPGFYDFQAGAAGRLTISSNLTVSSGVNTIEAPVTFNAPVAVSIATGASFAVDAASPFIATGVITKTGGGALVINGQATLSGGANIQAGTLQLSNASAANPNLISGLITIAPGAGLRIGATGNGTAANGPTAAPNSAIPTQTITLNGSTFQIDPVAGGTPGSFNTRFMTGGNGLLAQNEFNTALAAGSPTTQSGQTGSGGVSLTTGLTYNPGTATPTAWYYQSGGATAGPTATFIARLTGALQIVTGGNYTFETASDDASRLYIDNKLVVLNDNGHGVQTYISPTINLAAGLHEFRVDYEQGTGGDQLNVSYAGQFANSDTGATANTYKIIGANTAAGAITNGIETLDTMPLGDPVTLTGGNSTVTTGTNTMFTQVGLGALTFAQGAGNPATLTIGGLTGKSIHFASMVLQAGTSTTNTISNDNAPDVYVDGQVTLNGTGASTLIKSGNGQLFFTNTTNATANNLTGLTIDLTGGRFVALGSTSATSGTASPVAGATLQLDGGTLVLDAKAGTLTAVGPTFDNQLNVTTGGTIELQDSAVVTTLGSASHGVLLSAGQTLTINPLASDTNPAAELKIAGAISSTGAANIVVNSTNSTNSTSNTGLGVVVIASPANNSGFSGNFTINAGYLQANGLASLTPAPFGTASISLVAPATGLATGLFLKSDGAGSNGGPIVFGGATPTPLTISGTGSTFVDVNDITATVTGNVISLGALTTTNTPTLNTTGGSGYSLAFTSTTLGGNTTFKPGTANVNLGAIGGTGNLIVVETPVGSVTVPATPAAAAYSSGPYGTNATVSLTLPANTYTGTITVSSGVILGTSASLGGNIATPGGVNAAGAAWANAATSNAAAVVFDQTLGGLSSGTFAKTITGAGAVLKNNAGTVTLTGSNNYTGGTIINGGTVVGSSASLGTGNIVNNAALVLDQTAAPSPLPTGTFNGTITGTGSVTKQNAGTLTLNGLQTYAGATVVTGGTLQLTPVPTLVGAGTTGPAAYYSFDSASGTTVNNGGNLSTKPTAALNNGATITSGGGIVGNAMSISGPTQYLSVNPTATNGISLNNAGGYTASAWFNTLYTTTAATKTWRTLFRGNANDHQLILNQDPAQSGFQIGTYYNVAEAGGATSGNAAATFNPVQYGGNNDVDLNPQAASGWHMITEVGSGTSTQVYIDGVFAGDVPSRSLTDIYSIGNYQGGGQPFAQKIDEVYIYQRALSGGEVNALYNYTLSGNSTLPTGTGNLPASTPLQLAAGATLDLNGATQFVGSLADVAATPGGTISNSAAAASALVINQASSTTFSGSIINGTGAGGVSLTKTGSGAVTFAGASTYTGATSVSQGMLNITGSLGATAVTVSNNATLGGSGAIGAVASLASVNITNGVLAPGDQRSSPATGSLSVVGAVTLGANSVFSPTVSATASTPLVVGAAGSLTVDPAAILTPLFSASSVPNSAATYVLIDNKTTSLTTSRFANAAQGSTVTVDGVPFTITYQYVNPADADGIANDVALVGVPEPTALSLIALGAVGLLARRRRQTANS